MIKAKCEVVAKMGDDGEEVRLYADGECVKTVHLHGKDRGKYVKGEEYDVEAPAPKAQVSRYEVRSSSWMLTGTSAADHE